MNTSCTIHGWSDDGAPCCPICHSNALDKTQQRIIALEAEVLTLREDADRMNFLEVRGNGMPWMCRDPYTGRGYALYTDHCAEYSTARDAIDAARREHYD